MIFSFDKQLRLYNENIIKELISDSISHFLWPHYLNKRHLLNEGAFLQQKSFTKSVLWVFNFCSSWIYVFLIIEFTRNSVIVWGKEELLELSWLELNPNKDENHEERQCLKNENLPSLTFCNRGCHSWRRSQRGEREIGG